MSNNNEDERGMGMGPNGECVCPRCGYAASHETGVPCQTTRCPDCDAKLMRRGSRHHLLAQERNGRAGALAPQP